MKTSDVLSRLSLTESDVRYAQKFIQFEAFDEEISLQAALMLALLDLTTKIGFKLEQRYAILEALKDHLVKDNQVLNDSILIADNQYLALKKWKQFYDFKNLTWIDPDTVEDPLILVSISIPALLFRCLCD